MAKLARFRDEQDLTFPLLSDVDRTALDAYGAYGEKKLYGKTVVGVIRSTFVVGADGVCRGGSVQREGNGACREVAQGTRDLAPSEQIAVRTRGRSPMAEARGLGPRQCEFDSRRPYIVTRTRDVSLNRCSECG